MFENTEHLIQVGGSNENIDTKKGPIFGNDDHRITRPDDASCSERSCLSWWYLVCWTADVFDTCDHQTLDGRDDIVSKYQSTKTSVRSLPTIAKRTHLNAGAQKKTVFGPASWFQSGLNPVGTILSPNFTSPRYTADAILTRTWGRFWYFGSSIRISVGFEMLRI